MRSFNSPLTKSSHLEKDTSYGMSNRNCILYVVLPIALTDFVNGLLSVRSQIREMRFA